MTNKNVKQKKIHYGRTGQFRIVLFVFLIIQVMVIFSLFGCGKKAPPVPPKESKQIKAADIKYL
jgi:hypothetical protein